jgi:hypothetical protein
VRLVVSGWWLVTGRQFPLWYNRARNNAGGNKNGISIKAEVAAPHADSDGGVCDLGGLQYVGEYGVDLCTTGDTHHEHATANAANDHHYHPRAVTENLPKV